MYFAAPRHSGICLGLLSAIACGLLIVTIPLASPLSNNLLIPLFLPWFVVGIAFHALLISAGTLESVALYAAGVPGAVPFGVTLAVPILFAAAIWPGPFAGVLAARPMAGIGVASYGLYLLHQNVGVAILHSLPALTAVGGALAAIGVAAGCTAVAAASFRWIETPLARVLRVRLLPAGTRGRRDAHGARAPHGRRLPAAMSPQDRAAGVR